jgi:hypothetical protein
MRTYDCQGCARTPLVTAASIVTIESIMHELACLGSINV